jgi:putative DNA primase/helicase
MHNKNNNITPELIRAALAHIPANCDRETWARVAMAIKSEFADSTGRDLFTDWSATADAFNAGDAGSTWRSVKAGGGVGIGTLLHLAKEHGFTLPKADQAPAAPTHDELVRREQEKAARAQADKARTEEAHAGAAHEASALWQEASDTGESPYLIRKGVKPYGVRFASGGWLLVPVRDVEGMLWNLQRIAPAPAVGDGPDKLFLKNGRKSGLWHLLGDVGSPDTTASPNTDTSTVQAVTGPEVLIVAEGYATAASVHEATGRPVAVAFDAGNLAHVAKTLHAQYPAALIVVAGDDDRATHASTGKNPGRDKASAAARAVQGLAVFPEPLPEGGSDFNDLHQAAGLEAVRACIEAAIAAHQAQQAATQRTPASKASQTRQSTRQEGHDASDGDGQDTSDTARAYDPFTVSDDGVWHTGRDQDGNDKRPEWVCSRLDVEALTRDQDGSGWGYLLNFADSLGKVKTWPMPARMLSGDGGEYRAALLNSGLRIAPSPRARNLLTQFIQTRQPGTFASCTDRIGWHGRAFVLPRETIGDDAERIVFQSENQIENTFTLKGTAQAWRERVGALCAGNSRLVFAVACAFAGPLLRPAGVESGGFHLRGDSSSGKTTALKVAASVYGGASYLQRWRTTDNALEAIAAQHSDCLLILDELAQVEPKVAGECAYLLANEQGKARATRTGTPRARLAWRLLFLSAGELGLADHMAEGMKRTRTGQEVRMSDIPADAGAGMGAFEHLHGFDGGSAFSRHVTGQAASVYGATGRAWLEWLTTHADTLKARIRAAAAALGAQLVPEAASGQVERVGARFALVGAAGELATEAGLTGWAKGESENAARACFNAWLAARGGIGNGEVVAMLRAVRRFLETHGDGRFAMWHRAADDHAAKTLHRAGVRRMLNAEGQPIKSDPEHQREYGERMPAALGESVSFEYFILAETFKGEVCQGFDAVAVCRVLLDHACLIPDKGRPFDCKPRLPGLGLTRCYRIPPAIFALDL